MSLSKYGTKTFRFAVKGQNGEIPQIGLGTAGLEDKCVSSVVAALNVGYRHLDTALLYNNQEDVGKGIRKSNVPRNQIWVTSKVGFFPKNSEGVWMYNPNNIKGSEHASITLSLNQLGLDYVDLFLIHNPCVSIPEYNAATLPHSFELVTLMAKVKNLPELPVIPKSLIDGELLRPLITSAKHQTAFMTRNPLRSLKERRRSWAAMERAKREGKCRYIGVSNYPAELLLEMKDYAEIMPAINQLEFHPRYASPKLRRVAKELGVVLTGYGTGLSVKIEEDKTIASIAARIGRTPMQVVLRWTIQSGVVVIPRSSSLDHIKENLQIFDFELSPTDMQILDNLNKDYPYYWDPVPTIQSIQQRYAKM